jgi:hypothetical protein
MNDDILDVVEPVEYRPEQEVERFAEVPRPLVPKRTIVRFQISDERGNSEG